MNAKDLRNLIPEPQTIKDKMKKAAKQGGRGIYVKKGDISERKIKQLEKEDFIISYTNENVHINW